MKFVSALTLLFSLTIASANPLLEKRASINDKATEGYATLSGDTSGGGSATPVTITTLEKLKAALTGTDPKILLISGTITGNEVIPVPPNTSVIRKSGATLTGVGFHILSSSNVIIRNLKVNLVLAAAGDAVSIQASNRVWVDHVELWSDREHDMDYYDGLLDITHGSYAVTVTYSYLHDHWGASLVGHPDSNESEDAAIQVTYGYNKWYNLNSRTPSFRFGHGHIYNNLFLSNNNGINARIGSTLVVENNDFESASKPVYTTDGGCFIAQGNLSPVVITSPFYCGTTSFPYRPYTYTLTASASVKAYVDANSGAILPF